LTTLYLTGAKTTDSWRVRKGEFAVCFSSGRFDGPSPKLSFIANDNNPIGVGLALCSSIHFGSLEFNADRFHHLSLSL
jgi:hypothetical protein